LQLAEALDTDAILAMHHALMEETDRHAGKFRQEINWIGGNSPVTAMFVPPEHTQVPNALNDLVRFMERTDVAAIVQAAMAHAQFETIHPFTDGNGRTGRALISAILRARGTTQNFTVPLSSGLLNNTNDYFNALNEYRQGNVEPIIHEFVDAARRAMSNVQVLMHDLEQLKNKILDTGHRKTKNLRIIADLCTTQPAFTAPMVEQIGVSNSSAYTIIKRLVKAKILRDEGKLAGQSVWSVVGLTDALDAFAERAGNRTSMWQ